MRNPIDELLIALLTFVVIIAIVAWLSILPMVGLFYIFGWLA